MRETEVWDDLKASIPKQLSKKAIAEINGIPQKCMWQPIPGQQDAGLVDGELLLMFDRSVIWGDVEQVIAQCAASGISHLSLLGKRGPDDFVKQSIDIPVAKGVK